MPQEVRVAERTTLLRDIALDMFSSGSLPETALLLRGGRIPLLVKGYFILNAAYKEWRMPNGHLTETPKIAALQCLAITRFAPFKPIDPTNVTETNVARANEIYAMAYALGILGKTLKPDTPQKVDFWLRILDIIHECPVETLEPFVVDADLQIDRPIDDYQLDIHSTDQMTINALVSIFELISKKVEAS